MKRMFATFSLLVILTITCGTAIAGSGDTPIIISGGRAQTVSSTTNQPLFAAVLNAITSLFAATP